MSYNTVARAAMDGDLHQRLTAAAAQEGHPSALSFIQQNVWTIVADPSIAAPYASAIAARIDHPGLYEDVITDGAILAVIQPMVQAVINPPDPNPAP